MEALAGGYWSTAFSYVVGGTPSVLRLGASGEGYDIDRQAFQFCSSDLPVPKVLDIGQALDHHFAISERHFGRFLEVVDESKSHEVTSTLAGLLAALRANKGVKSLTGGNVEWYEPEGSGAGCWQDWLRRGLGEESPGRLARWRQDLGQRPEIELLLRRTFARIDELWPFVEERRDLVHGDLLHQNVLISDDGIKITGVFSWKCSAFGDFLYDVAWCTPLSATTVTSCRLPRCIWVGLSRLVTMKICDG